MFSIACIKVGNASYYVNQYYNRENMPGVWLGEGAKALGLHGQTARPKEFIDLLFGYGPDGEKLVRNAGRDDRQLGHDYGLSMPKSVSAWRAAAPAWLQAAVDECDRDSIMETVIPYMETLATTRTGAGGKNVQPAKMAIAAYAHFDSREKDPQKHWHLVIPNISIDDLGRSRTLMSQPFFDHQHTIDKLYLADLASRLERRLGVEIERHKSWFELKDVPQDLCQFWSKRSEQIEEAVGGSRENVSAEALQRAAVETRKAKDYSQTLAELDARWKAEAERYGLTQEAAFSLLGRSVPRDEGRQMREALDAALTRLTQRNSAFAERDLLRFAAEESLGRGVGAKAIQEAVTTYLQVEARYLGNRRGLALFTTPEHYALEERVLSAVERLRQANGQAIDQEAVSRAAIAKGLNDEQTRAVEHLTAGSRISVLSGLAGTGKSSSLSVARTLFEAQGRTVIGACVSGIAAENLEKSSGIKSETLARTLMDLDSGFADQGKRTYLPPERIRLTKEHVLIIDEAGMLSTADLERVLTHIERSGATLLVCGDSAQLQAVGGAGGGHKAVGLRVGEATLQNIQRQRSPADREVVRNVLAGLSECVLQSLRDRGLLTVENDLQGKMKKLVADWKADGLDLRQKLIFAGTNYEGAAINRRCQEELGREGRLSLHSLKIGDDSIHVGDRVLMTRNSRKYGLKNGHIGTVNHLDPVTRTLGIKFDDGRVAMIPTKDYEHIKLGFCVTTHKGQGSTVERAYVVAGGSMQDKEITYVQLSRAREKTFVYADEMSAGPELRILARQMRASRAKAFAHDIEAELRSQVRQETQQIQAQEELQTLEL